MCNIANAKMTHNYIILNGYFFVCIPSTDAYGLCTSV